MFPFIVRIGAGLAAALCALPLWALDPSRALTQSVQTVWRMEEGLPHNSLRSLLQARNGYLWLGTYGGLVRFDGVRFVVFDNRNSRLRDNEIRALAEARDGTLWIGTTSGGLHRLVGGEIHPFDGGIGRRTINDLQTAPDGTLWVATTDGLYAVRGGIATRYAQQQGLSNTFVTSLAPAADGLWIATTGGLFRLRAGRIAKAFEYESTDMSTVLSDRAGRIWLGVRDHALQLQSDAATGAMTQLQSLALPGAWGGIWAFLEDRNGNIWMGTYGGGLFRRSPDGTLDQISSSRGFPDHRAWSLLEDAEGNLWVGTRGGLVRMRDGAATTWSTQEGLPADVVRTVMEDADSAIWIGGEEGLSCLRGRTLWSLRPRDGLTLNPARTILRDRRGRFWVGGDGGLFEVDTVRRTVLRSIGPADGLTTASIRNLVEDRSGRVWIGTSRGIVVAPRGLGEGPIEVPAELAAMSTLAIEALFEDRNGAIWIGTLTDGVRRWQNGRVEKPVLLADTTVGVRSVQVTADGTVYLGTVGTGLFVGRPGRPFRRVTTRDGLPDDAIWSILERGDVLWMSSDRGVFAVDRASILDVVDGRRTSVDVRTVVGTQDGMKSRECNGGGVPAALIARDGRIWVPTSRGAVAIDPAKLSRGRFAPPVAIEEIVADRRAVPHARTIEIAPGVRDLEVHFTGLSFVDPAHMRFRYRLEGHDDNWNETGHRRVAYFSALPPGTYELHVQAANADGVWNDAGARLELRVLPRLHEAWWFRLLVAAAVAGLVWGWLALRTAAHQAREAKLKQLVRERTEELERANARLEELAAVDDLTGIANHRHFVATLEEEWRRAARSGAPVSLLMCDVDDFKAYNDTYGHLEGDECLKRVARAMGAVLAPRSDLVARYGGEEFAIVLPSTDAEGARLIAERIRVEVQALRIDHPGSRTGPHLTVSIGSATVPPEATAAGSVTDLIAAADDALYAAKLEGRNRVVVRRG